MFLGLVFLAAQFHLCADLSTAGSGWHFCPYCASTGAAIEAPAPAIFIAPANAPFESVPAQIRASAGVRFSIAPRAPPAL